MRDLARFLSLAALFSVLFTFSLSYLGIPSFEFEITVFVSAIGIFLALAAGGLALLFAAILFARNDDPKPITTSILAITALALAGIWVVISY